MRVGAFKNFLSVAMDVQVSTAEILYLCKFDLGKQHWTLLVTGLPSSDLTHAETLHNICCSGSVASSSHSVKTRVRHHWRPLVDPAQTF